MQKTFTERAVAYLKASLPEGDDDAVVLSPEDSPIIRPLVDGLCVCYVVDEDDAFHYVQRRHLAKDGISEEQLHRIGLQNLLQIASSGNLRVQPCQNGVYGVLMGGNFESSLILLDHLWDDSFRQFVQGEYAVAIPNRDMLAFCDGGSKAGLDELRKLIERIHTSGDHPTSERIYVRYENAWKPQTA